MLRFLVTLGTLAFALSGTALAQSAPAAAPPAGRERAARPDGGAAFALRLAYRSIAEAEARGASGYLDAAKTHYRGALARLGRHDRGAASEALAAAALARAAIAEHPLPAPRDVPAPPPLIAAGPRGPRPQAPGGPMHDGPMMGGERGMGGRFDATALAADAKVANSAEAREFAERAVEADVASTRAAFSGNADEAMRQGRLASDLALAVRALARADHPRAFGGGIRAGARRGPATIGSVPAAP